MGIPENIKCFRGDTACRNPVYLNNFFAIPKEKFEVGSEQWGLARSNWGGALRKVRPNGFQADPGSMPTVVKSRAIDQKYEP